MRRSGWGDSGEREQGGRADGEENEFRSSLQFSNCPEVILFYPPVTRNSLSAVIKVIKQTGGAQFFRNSVPISDFYRHLLLGLRSGGLNAILKLYSLKGVSRKGGQN